MNDLRKTATSDAHPNGGLTAPSWAWTGRVHRLLGWMLFGVGWVTQATQNPPTAVEELARRAETVVHGRVESVETLLTPAGRRLTRVEVTPVEIWKGSATNRLGVVLASGVLGEHWVKVVGEPEYRPGEEVVVFAVVNEFGEAVTLNLSQGKFAVTAAGPEKFVSNGLLGGAPGGQSGVRPRHLLPLRLESLRDRVREALTPLEVRP